MTSSLSLYLLSDTLDYDAKGAGYLGVQLGFSSTKLIAKSFFIPLKQFKHDTTHILYNGTLYPLESGVAGRSVTQIIANSQREESEVSNNTFESLGCLLSSCVAAITTIAILVLCQQNS